MWPVVDIDRFAPADHAQGGHQRAAAGPIRRTVGLAHGLDVLVEASRLAGPDLVQTTIAGDGADAERLRTIVRERRVANVRMLGTVAADRVPALYSECDAERRATA